jgi:hypothetical protein
MELRTRLTESRLPKWWQEQAVLIADLTPEDSGRYVERLLRQWEPTTPRTYSALLAAVAATAIQRVQVDTLRTGDGALFIRYDQTDRLATLLGDVLFFLSGFYTHETQPPSLLLSRWSDLLDPNHVEGGRVLPTDVSTWLAEEATKRLAGTVGRRQRGHLERLAAGQPPPGFRRADGTTVVAADPDDDPQAQLLVAVVGLLSDVRFLAATDRMQGLTRWSVPAEPLDRFLQVAETWRATRS